MTTGTIVYYKNESGFGFIVPTGFDRNDRDNNIFFHVKNVV
jgi:cold shock CspA family protein